jgi:hypothetical protein
VERCTRPDANTPKVAQLLFWSVDPSTPTLLQSVPACLPRVSSTFRLLCITVNI